MSPETTYSIFVLGKSVCPKARLIKKKIKEAIFLQFNFKVKPWLENASVAWIFRTRE